MIEDTNPDECKQCRQMELSTTNLADVAKHWVMTHQTYLQILAAALTIQQCQQYGILSRG